MVPPNKTDGMAPIKRAVSPDSNAPISLDEPYYKRYFYKGGRLNAPIE